MDEQEFDEFYSARFAPLVRLLFLQTGDARRAEDSAQEAFLRAWQRRRQLNSKDPVRWVTQVAFRIAVSEWRRSQRLKAILQRIRPPEAPSSKAPEDLTYVVQLLKGLTSEQRSVVILHYLNDLSVNSTADLLGISAGTVKSRLSRARDHLRAAITQEDPHDRTR